MRPDSVRYFRSDIVAIGLISIAVVMILSSGSSLRAEESVRAGESVRADESMRAAEQFPYAAIVRTSEAMIQSGPGDAFYETDRLGKGSEVEVWRHVEGGWCAIRPPVSSFSWVAAEHLEITDDPNLARVINVPVKTRVGSRFSNVRDVEYISLRRGEVVELLGTSTLTNEVGEPVRWFKIAPPAGEFRWVHSKYLTPNGKQNTNQDAGDAVGEVAVGTESIKTFDLPADGKRKLRETIVAALQPTPNQNAQAAFVEMDNQVRTVAHEELVESQVEEVRTEEVPAEETTLVPISQADPWLSEAKPETTASTKPVKPTPHINAVTWETVGKPNDILSAPEPRSFEESYDALNLMLSRSVLGSVESWRLSEVKAQTERLLAMSDTLEQQDLARSLLVKIGDFQTLQSRKLSMAAEPSNTIDLTAYRADLAKPDEAQPSSAPSLLPTVQPDAQMPKGPEMPTLSALPKKSATKPTIPKLDNDKSLDNSVFDASGMLIAVQARRRDMPRYALTDSSGQITRFVSTPRGVDLSRYVNSRVGILGTVGYLRKFNKPHVVAEQVVYLKR